MGVNAADFTQTVGTAQLTKQHRHQLVPALEAFGRLLGLQFEDRLGKMLAINQRNYLRKTTGCLYHKHISVRAYWFFSNLNIPDTGDTFY